MPVADVTSDDGSVEECLDELGEALTGLNRYSLSVIAIALRVHLQAALQVMLMSEMASPPEVRAFVRGLEYEALEYESGSGCA